MARSMRSHRRTAVPGAGARRAVPVRRLARGPAVLRRPGARFFLRAETQQVAAPFRMRVTPADLAAATGTMAALALWALALHLAG
jgi:hypothetical protein